MWGGEEFWVLIPVRTRYTQQCAYCGAAYDLSKAEARHLVAG
ncbi:hypothetical protein [Micromonospora avicenniae]